MAHNNINASVEDVEITVTESLNDSIFKSLSRVEHTLNEMMLMMEQPPHIVVDEFNVNEAWEKQLSNAIITALRRHGQLNLNKSHIIVDTVIAIMKGLSDDTVNK